MANEIQVAASLAITQNGLTANLSFNLAQTLAGNCFNGNVQTIPTTAGGTALTIPPALTPGGWLLVKNLSPTNNVTITTQAAAASNINTVATLLPGEACLWKPAPTCAPAAIAIGAPADIAACWTEL